MKISLVIPIYNEEPIIEEVIEKYISDLQNIKKELGIDYEVICVNDASTDGTVNILKKEFRIHTAIKIIHLAERTGKQGAIVAGMDASTGDAIIIADIDLLNPVGVIKQVVEKYITGHQIVYAYREKIKTEKIKKAYNNFFVNFANHIFSINGRYTGKPQIQLFSRDVADILIALPHKNMKLRTLDTWTGYTIHTIIFPSEYSKKEIREKLRKQSTKRKESTKSITYRRDKLREHTPSVIYALMFLLASMVVFAVILTIIIVDSLSIRLGTSIILILLQLTMLSATFMYWAKAVLIKRIGRPYRNKEDTIYRLKPKV